ncbi:hypothetical protein [Streptomyces sp. NPDC001774]
MASNSSKLSLATACKPVEYKMALCALAAYGSLKMISLLVLFRLLEYAGRYRENTPRFGGGQHPWDVLGSWDGWWYMQIASQEYRPAIVPLAEGQLFTIEQNSAAFFPLYPGLMRIISRVTGMGLYGAGMTVSVVASFVAAAGIYRVVGKVCDTRTGVIAAGLWAVMPGAGVQWSVYSESLYAALAAWSCYGVLVGAWTEVAILCCLAGATRPPAIALVIAVCVAATVALCRRQIELWRLIVVLLVAPAGIGAYIGWLGWSLKDPLAYFTLQQQAWAHSFDFGSNAYTAVKSILLGHQDYLFPSPAQDLTAVLFLLLLPVLLLLMARMRIPVVLSIYTVTAIVLMMASVQMFGTIHRFLLPLFPLAIPVACALRRLTLPYCAAVLGFAGLSSGWYAGFLLFGLGIP